MKFANLFFMLLFSIFSNANNINYFNLLKRKVEYNEDAFLNNLSPECKEEYLNSEYYIDCEPDIQLSNYKDICFKFNSEKCQTYYENPLNYYPHCKENPEFSKMYQPILLKSMKQSYDLICQTDEEGNLCPFSIHTITKTGGAEVLLDQCKSKKCTESLINTYKNVDLDQLLAFEELSSTSGNVSYNELNSMKNIVTVLESNTCKSVQAKASSDTVTTINNNCLIIFLSLLLIFLFY